MEAMTTAGNFPDSLKASEKLEAFINQMMKKAETLHTTREEQIVKKQQILDELQKVEHELQEKAKQQLLLNTQQKIEAVHTKHLERGEADGGESDAVLVSGLDSETEEFIKQMQATALLVGSGDRLSCAPKPVPLHIALKKDLEAQLQAAIETATNNKDTSSITRLLEEANFVNGPFDDEEEDKEAVAAPPVDGDDDDDNDDDQDDDEDDNELDDEDGEDIDGRKLPQLAKQESLSSVASSADSGCGNSDINHNGDSAAAAATGVTKDPPSPANADVEEEDVESNEASAAEMLENEEAVIEQILHGQISDDLIDLTGVRPISDSTELKHQLTQQQLDLLRHTLLEQQKYARGMYIHFMSLVSKRILCKDELFTPVCIMMIYIIL